MMDIAELGASVANVMAGQLQGLGSLVADQARSNAAAMIYQFAAARLRATPLGARTLDALEAAPADADRVDQLAQTVGDEVRRDPEFGRQLQDLLDQMGSTTQGAIGPGATAIGNINLSATGPLSNKNSILAGAGAIVTHVRSTRINTGGIVAIIVATLFYFGGALAVGVAAVDAVIETPSEVVDSFLEASFASDITRMKSYTCAAMLGEYDENEIMSDREDLASAEISWKIVDEVRSGSHATVRIEFRLEGETDADRSPETLEGNFGLVNEDGWKVCSAFGTGD
ncbi:hypothetical protein ACFP2T_37210 [Plantactinospora solaniradicis]|uniref:DUF4878 domain-containing protein n=1 Tax=Plantactinospora solaniradicis TaxID=1723736 RepID=A0ABW1KJ59_9ACTN